MITQPESRINMEETALTFNQIAERRKCTRLGAYMKFKRNRDKLVEGTDYFTKPFHTSTMITQAGYAKLYPAAAAVFAPMEPVTSHRYQFNLSVC